MEQGDLLAEAPHQGGMLLASCLFAEGPGALIVCSCLCHFQKSNAQGGVAAGDHKSHADV